MPDRDLLAEYGLWSGAYETLAALRDGGPLTWPHPTLDAISGNPAKALRIVSFWVILLYLPL
jgi:hypothetical protein